jgi:acyl-CoA reductase-like NAD-dependent aldehyde dehydrogenase
MPPTAFIDVPADAEIATEEIFGPVSVIHKFKTEGEVIQLANDTEFGLMAGVKTTLLI